MRQLLLLTALMACCAAHAQQAPAPEPASPITDRFALRVSGFFGSVTTYGRVDDPTTKVTGTPFSLEKDFHLCSCARQARAEFMFRLRERGRLRVDLWELNRSGVASPTVPITYNGQTFTPGELVISQFNWRQVDFTWTYSFLRSSRFELGAGLGLHLLEAEADADVPNATPVPLQEQFTGAGPFITPALDGTWRISQRFAFSARGQYLKLAVNSVRGSLGDFHGDLQFRWRPNLAFGLGYESTQTRIDVSSSHPTGFARLGTHGPELFVRASF
jgi:hypothetical protein